MADEVIQIADEVLQMADRAHQTANGVLEMTNGVQQIANELLRTPTGGFPSLYVVQPFRALRGGENEDALKGWTACRWIPNPMEFPRPPGPPSID